MAKAANCLVAQSGGPTAAINFSVCSAIQQAIKSEEIGTVFKASNVIPGVRIAGIYAF
jgi:6-phosphofructokinase 1